MNSDCPPACIATGTPSRYRTRFFVSAGTRAPGVTMPVRLSGSAALSETRSPFASCLRNGAHRRHGVGQRVLFAAHARDEASAANLSLRLEPAEHAQQRVPGRQPVGFALEHFAEHDAVTAQQDFAPPARVPRRRSARRALRIRLQRPASSSPNNATRRRRATSWRFLSLGNQQARADPE